MLAAMMAPRTQLVAAEEGLSTWLQQTTQSKEEAAVKAVSESRPLLASSHSRPARSPQPPKIFSTKAPERDDTPGLIAFSAFLLLPLAFQLGRYFENKDQSWPKDSALLRILMPEHQAPTVQPPATLPRQTFAAKASKLMWDSDQ